MNTLVASFYFHDRNNNPLEYCCSSKRQTYDTTANEADLKVGEVGLISQSAVPHGSHGSKTPWDYWSPLKSHNKIACNSRMSFVDGLQECSPSCWYSALRPKARQLRPGDPPLSQRMHSLQLMTTCDVITWKTLATSSPDRIRRANATTFLLFQASAFPLLSFSSTVSWYHVGRCAPSGNHRNQS